MYNFMNSSIFRKARTAKNLFLLLFAFVASTCTVNASPSEVNNPSPINPLPLYKLPQITDLSGTHIYKAENVSSTTTTVVAPPIAVDDNVTINEDEKAIGSVATNDSDPENDVLTYTQIGSVSQGVFVLSADGKYTFQPNANFHGTVIVDYRVCDPSNACATAKLTITVVSQNDAPKAEIDVVFLDEDTPYSSSAALNDEDADNAKSQLVYTKIGTINEWLFFMSPNGNYSFTPRLNFNGIVPFTYKVCDPAGLCDTSTVIFIIGPVNDAPVAPDFTRSTKEDSTITGDLKTVVYDVDNAQTELSYTFLSITPNTGTFTINPNGTYTFVPRPDFSGIVTVTYRVCDPAGLCDEGTITIFISPVNDPPVALDDNIPTTENQPVTNTVATNDSDVDDPKPNLVYSVVTPPTDTEGVLTLNPDGTYTFTPKPYFNGPVTITYRVCDTSGTCDTARLVINVQSVDDPPVVTVAPITLPEDSSKKQCFPITDPDAGATHTVTVCGAEAGIAEAEIVGSTVCVTYTPYEDYSGPDTICIEVCDNTGLCNKSYIPVVVTPVNDPPSISVTPVTVDEDVPTEICYPISEIDSDDSHTTSICDRPKHGTASVTLEDDQICLTYTPAPEFNGLDSVCIRVCDAAGACVNNVVVIDVTPINDPPVVVVSTPVTVAEDATTTQCFPLTDKDPADTHTVNPCGAKNGTAEVTLESGKVCVKYTPNPNFNGVDTVCVKVCDSGGICIETSVPIVITPVNDTPVVVTTPILVAEDMPSTRCFPITDIDAGDTYNASICKDGVNGTATVNIQNNQVCLTYSPKKDFNGLDSVCIKICDAAGACIEKIVNINVSSDNDPPSVTVSPIVVPEDSTILACFPIVDTDAFDTHTVTICGEKNGKSIPKVENGQVCITYTPNLNYNGPDTVCLNVCDAAGACIQVFVPITVTPKNDPPLVVVTPVLVNEDTTIITCLNINNIDGNETYTAGICEQGKNGNAITLIQNGQICVSYTPKPNFNGKDSICVKVCDPSNACTDVIIPITVLPKSDTPAVVIVPVIATEDSVITTCLNVIDVDGDAINSASICKDNNGKSTAEIKNGQVCITYTPNLNFNGKDSVCVRVCDVTNECIEVIIPITVTPKNDTPSVVVTPVIVNADYVVTQCFPIIDIDGDSKFNAIICDKGKGEASVEIKNGQACITYKAPNVEATNDTICLIVCDSVGGCKQIEIPITINVCTDVSVPSLTCPQAMEVNMAGNILLDPDKFLLTSTVSDDCHSNILTFNNPYASHPCGNVATTQTSGLLSGSLFNEGEHTLIFEAKNRTGQVATCSTKIVVRPISLLVSKTITLCPNDPIVVMAQNYNGGTYEWQKNNQVVSKDNELLNTMASPDQNGMYVLSASFGNCTMKDTVEVKVNAIPTATNDAYFMAAEDTLSRSVTINDNILNNKNAIIRLATNANTLKGNLSFNSNGTFIFKPQNGYSGIEKFDYEVCYTECPNVCAKASVNIEIISTYRATNVITPNGDNDNEAFIIEGYDPTLASSAQSEITFYNQWGDVVYNTKGYKNDWRGDYKGEPLPSGTYYFFFRKNPDAAPVKGFVTILR
jgi:large repetitive protein